MKAYGTNQRNLTETNAQDFIVKLDGLLQTKLAEAKQEETEAKDIA